MKEQGCQENGSDLRQKPRQPLLIGKNLGQMKDITKTKDTFRTIRVKIETAKSFRKFSRSFFKTHTEALQTMLDFFFYNEISPKESLGPTGRTLGNLIKKRFNAMAAMIKEMEKHGVNPTKAMMELLFEHAPQKNQRTKPPGQKGTARTVRDDAFFKSAFDAIELQKENTILKQDLNTTRKQLAGILDKVQVTKSGFGKTKLYLQMDVEKFENLKSTSVKIR